MDEPAEQPLDEGLIAGDCLRLPLSTLEAACCLCSSGENWHMMGWAAMEDGSGDATAVETEEVLLEAAVEGDVSGTEL